MQQKNSDKVYPSELLYLRYCDLYSIWVFNPGIDFSF